MWIVAVETGEFGEDCAAVSGREPVCGPGTRSVGSVSRVNQAATNCGEGTSAPR